MHVTVERSEHLSQSVLPWQGIFSLHRQVSSTPLAFSCVIRGKNNVIRGRTVNVHFIVEVGHVGEGQRAAGSGLPSILASMVECSALWL